MIPSMRSLGTKIECAASAAGILVSAEEAHELAAHVLMVYEAGRTLSLTTVPVGEAPLRHVVDSLFGIPEMQRGGGGAWADLGSGAGFPGIPLSICGHRPVDLVESTGKKARFLKTVKAALCLDGTVRGVRAEEAARETPGAYSAISARAVGSLPELVELAAPLLSLGGVLVAWKGALEDEELRRGESAALLVGLTLRDVSAYRLPGSDAGRALVVFQRTGRPSVALPRRAGLAKKSPLA